MDRDIKRKIRDTVVGNIKHQKTLSEIKDILEDVLTQHSLAALEYLETKFIKYTVRLVSIDLKEKFSEKSTTLQDLKEFLDDLDEPDKLFFNPGKIFGSANYASLLTAKENSFNFTKRQYCNRFLKSNILNDLTAEGKTRIEATKSLPSSSFLNSLVEYVADFKTQFTNAIEASAEDLINCQVLENTTAEWNTFVISHREDASRHSAAHKEKYENLWKERESFRVPTDLGMKGLEEIITKLRAPLDIHHQKNYEAITVIARRPIFVLSRHLKELEDYIEGIGPVSQVEFQASKVFFIDTSLRRSKWHGKNIIVNSGQIFCTAEHLYWDLSGVDGEAHVNAKADDATIPGGDGVEGNPGLPGESGGNIVMIADKYTNIEMLSISTNGGKGAAGQNGGNGANGENGINGNFMRLENFQQRFKCLKASNIHETIVETVNFLRSSSEPFHISVNGFDNNGNISEDPWFPKRYIHLHGTLNSNLKYEYCFSQTTLGKHMYVLVNGEDGTLGTAGGFGGFGGKGAQGGYPGKVELFLFSKAKYSGALPSVFAESGKPGKDGTRGNHGKNGETGKKGEDIGMLDYYMWTRPVYFNNEHFVLRNQATSSATSVWCSRYETYRTIEKHFPEKRLPRVRDAPDGDTYRQRQAVALKKSAIDINKAIASGETFSVGTTFDASKEQQSWEERTAISAEANEKNELNRKSSVHRDTAGLYQAYNSNHPKSSQDKSSIVFDKNLFCNIVLSELEKTRLNAIISAYSVQELDLWERCLLHQPTMPDTNSFFHALYGSDTDGFIAINRDEIGTVRKKKTKKLCDFIRNKKDSLSEEILSLLKETFSNLARHIEDRHLKSEVLFQKYSEMLLVNLLSGNLTVVVEDEDVHDILEYAVNTGGTTVSSLIHNPSVMNLLFDILSNVEVSLYEHEAKLFVAAEEKTLEILKPMSTAAGIVRVPEALKSTHSSQNILYLVHNMSGFYAKMLPVVVRSWEATEKSIFAISLPEPSDNNEYDDTILSLVGGITQPNKIEAAKLYLKLFLAATREETGRKKVSANLMLSELVSAIETWTHVLPLVHIMLSNSTDEWVLEICLNLLEQVLIKPVESCDQMKTKLQEYRNLFSKFPENILYHLANHLKHSPSSYQKEFTDGTLSAELNGVLSKFKVFDTSATYQELSGVASVYQWHQQIAKIQYESQVRKFLPKLDWNEPSHRMSEIFYYYYLLADSFPHISEFLQICNSKYLQEDDHENNLIPIIDTLRKFNSGRWQINQFAIELLKTSKSFEDFHEGLENIALKNHVRSVDEIAQIIQEDPESNVNKEKFLSLARSKSSKLIYAGKSYSRTDLKRWSSNFRKQILTARSDKYTNMIVEAIDKVNGVIKDELNVNYNLRQTQVLSILAALHNLHDEPQNGRQSDIHTEAANTGDNNLLLQVKTGEGKSYIVLAVAIIKGIMGIKSDIVTSSSVLAQRDALKFRTVFEAFNLTVGTVTMDDAQQRTKEYQKTVVYGEVAHFQRDYLVDHFYRQNIRGNRDHQSLIIDEVDSMFLDKGNNVLYLSHHPAVLEALEGLFFLIWQTTVKTLKNGSYNPLQLYDTIQGLLSPSIQKDELVRLSASDERGVEKLWSKLQTLEVINCNGKLSPDALDKVYLSDTPILQPSSKKQALVCLIKYKVDTYTGDKFSKSVKKFIKLHLLEWIKSSYLATRMEEGVEYVLHVDRFSIENDKHEKILIIDLDTGVDLADSQWGDGLHQFLQLKHGCKLSPLSLKSVYISNISYFNMYKNLIGLTGTLGSNVERAFLETTYKAKFLVVPTAYPSSFVEEEPIVCSNLEEWLDRILQDVLEKYAQGRSSLLICEHIQHVNSIYDYFRKSNSMKFKIVIYRRDSDNCDVATSKKQLGTATVILSTNLAGRGTDIQLEQSLRNNGGLHVVLTYLPSNTRIRWQAMGRAARCGEMGSGRMIFNNNTLNEQCTAYTAIDCINQKEIEETSRINEILDYYKNVVKCEEEMFEEFRHHFDVVCRGLEKIYTSKTYDRKNLMEGKSQELKDIVMHSMLNDWAFWLDRYSNHIRLKRQRKFLSYSEKQYNERRENKLQSVFQHTFAHYCRILETYERTGIIATIISKVWGSESEADSQAISAITDDCLQLKLANIYFKNKEFSRALSILDLNQIILQGKSLNSQFSLNVAAARYYKVVAQFQELKKTPKELLPEVISLLEWFNHYRNQQIQMYHGISGNDCILNQNVRITNGLRAQKSATCSLLLRYIKSLQDLIGKAHTCAEDFADLLDGSIDTANILYQKLIQMEILIPSKFESENEGKDFQPLSKLARNYNATFSDSPNSIFDIIESETTENLSEVLESDKRPDVERFFKCPSIHEFLDEIKDAIIEELDVILLSASWGVTPINEISDWVLLHKQDGHKTMLLSTSSYDLQNFNGSILRVSKHLNSLEITLLLEENLASIDKIIVVDFQKIEAHKLNCYFKLNEGNLAEVPGLDNITAQTLFKELQKAGVLDSLGALKTIDIMDSLETLEGSCISNIPDEMKDQIIATIQLKCSYQYEKLRIMDLGRTNPRHFVSIKLPKDLFHNFIFSAYSKHIIRGVSPNPSKVKGNPNSPVSISVGTTDSFKNIFRRSLGTEELKLIFPQAKYEVVEQIKDVLYRYRITDKSDTIITSLDRFPTQEEIRNSVENRVLSKTKNYLELLSKLENASFRAQLTISLHMLRGSMYHPDCIHLLEQLSSKHVKELENQTEYKQERRRLEAVGLELIISTQFSKKFAAISIVVLGTGQIIGGFLATTTIYGIGVGPVIMTSGLQDIIYGIKSYRTGVFHWEDWMCEKLTSVAITAGTQGAVKLAGLVMEGETFAVSMRSVARMSSSTSPLLVDAFSKTGECFLQLLMEEAVCKYLGMHLQSLVTSFVQKLLSNILAETKRRISQHVILKTSIREAIKRQRFSDAKSTIQKLSEKSTQYIMQSSEIVQSLNALKPYLQKGTKLAVDQLTNQILQTEKISDDLKRSVTLVLSGVLQGMVMMAEKSVHLHVIYNSIDTYADKLAELLNIESGKTSNSQTGRGNQTEEASQVMELQEISASQIESCMREIFSVKIEEKFIKTAANELNWIFYQRHKEVQDRLQENKNSEKSITYQIMLAMAESEISKRRKKSAEKTNQRDQVHRTHDNSL